MKHLLGEAVAVCVGVVFILNTTYKFCVRLWK